MRRMIIFLIGLWALLLTPVAAAQANEGTVVFDGIAVVAGVLALVALWLAWRARQALQASAEQTQRGLQDVGRRLDKLTADLEQQQQKADAAAAERHRMLVHSIEQLNDRLTGAEHQIKAQEQEIANTVIAMSLLPLGDRQYRAKDLAGARETYERALRLSPHNPAILYRMGYVQCQRGELDDAENYLTQALNVDASFRPALATQGMVLRRRAETAPSGKERDAWLRAAEQKLLLALEGAPRLLDEDGESWWCTLGGLYRYQGRFDRAADAYQKAARITPYSSYPLGNLALYKGLKGDYEGMIQTYREVERLARMQAQANPEDYWAYADLLVARLALGKIQEAESILNVVLDIMPAELVYAGPSLLAILEKLMELVPEGRSHIEMTIKHVQDNAAARRDKAGVSLSNESFVIPLGELPALAVIVSNEDGPEDIVRVLDLVEARPAFFMLGGAMNMESEEMKITRTIIDEGIVPYAETYRMAVVDGGTDSGVMKLMGDARSDQRAVFPLIGVAPINLVKFEGHDNPNGYNLDPGHSHFVFTPEGDWGDETDMILALTQSLAGNGLKPSLGIVINGGQIVRQEVYRLVITERLRFPIIVLEGSGRFADTLAAAYRSGETDDDQLREIIRSGQIDLVSLQDGPAGMQAKLDSYFNPKRETDKA